MMIAMMVAGIGSVLAGLLVILYGIPIREFGFGNTLILIGVLAVCTGMLMLALSAVVAELKVIVRRLTDPRIAAETLPRPILPEPPQAQPAESPTAVAPPVAPLATQDETAPAAPAARPKRNLMFESSMRKDRERPTGEPPAGSFEDAWPRVDRGRNGDAPPQRRGARAPLGAPEANVAASSEPSPPAPAPPSEAQPGVTVLKSGVVDGMAYSLYSDGSIEAQMPEGLMRFASLDELTAHIDRRP
ncbi:MAG: hypothetical protein JOZ20_00225 [Sphingomonas sp.]|nr:hypothetical protein [Sphingomonas sp.]